MRTLKESWKEAPQAVEELEKEGEVYVTRTLKDGQMRMVFWNEIKPDEESGGIPVEKGVSSRRCYIHRPSYQICNDPFFNLVRVSRPLAFTGGSERR